MKKRRSRASKKGAAVNKADPPEINKNIDEQKAVDGLLSAFDSVTIEEAVAAYKQAEGDENKAAEILMNSLSEASSLAEDQSTTSFSSTGNFASASSSGTGSSVESQVFDAADFMQNGVRGRKGRSKKVVAAAGTVSTMLGKEYVRSTSKKCPYKSKEESQESWRNEAEQFLYCMLGDECELSMDVIRDVFFLLPCIASDKKLTLTGQCAYDVDKALQVLLDLSSSSDNSSAALGHVHNKKDGRSFLEVSSGLVDTTSDSISHSSESESYDSFWDMGHLSRNQLNTFAGTEAHRSRRSEQLEAEVSQKVLESLFKLPTARNTEHDPNTMNWKNIVKKLSSLQKNCETNQGDGVAVEYLPGRGNEYQVFRQASKQHWESMKHCYQKASTAFSNGGHDYAAYLSEQGRQHNKKALVADEKASRDIFKARNQDIENLITIDLHGQHVKQARRLLKLHLLFGAYVRSVRSFRVITGCGSHGVGRSKLKQSVIDILKREGIRWTEENLGTLFIKLDGQTEFSFLESDSDDD